MNEFIISLLGMVLSLLLSVIAYFLRQLHGNLKKMENDLASVKLATQLMKSEMKAQYALLRQRMEFLEQRE